MDELFFDSRVKSLGDQLPSNVTRKSRSPVINAEPEGELGTALASIRIDLTMLNTK